jgi:hypothetical protein
MVDRVGAAITSGDATAPACWTTMQQTITWTGSACALCSTTSEARELSQDLHPATYIDWGDGFADAPANVPPSLRERRPRWTGRTTRPHRSGGHPGPRRCSWQPRRRGGGPRESCLSRPRRRGTLVVDEGEEGHDRWARHARLRCRAGRRRASHRDGPRRCCALGERRHDSHLLGDRPTNRRA